MLEKKGRYGMILTWGEWGGVSVCVCVEGCTNENIDNELDTVFAKDNRNAGEKGQYERKEQDDIYCTVLYCA